MSARFANGTTITEGIAHRRIVGEKCVDRVFFVEFRLQSCDFISICTRVVAFFFCGGR